jgi:hypothetical protein
MSGSAFDRDRALVSHGAFCSVLVAVLLPVEELDGGLDELPVVLEDAAVFGVGIDDEFAARQAAVEVDRVRRGHHPVVVTVGDQHGLLDDGQIGGLMPTQRWMAFSWAR